MDMSEWVFTTGICAYVIIKKISCTNLINSEWSLNIVFILANIADPEEMPPYAAFHLGLHCLPKYLCTRLTNDSACILKAEPGKLDIERHTSWYSIYQFTSWFTPQTSNYDVIIDVC